MLVRRGEDRHIVGAEVFELLFPEGAALVRGVGVGQPEADLAQRLGPPAPGEGPWERTLRPADPHGNDRRVVLQAQVRRTQGGGAAQVDGINARFLSADRTDIDSAWVLVRAHLEKHHGAPGKEVGNVLTLVWRPATGGKVLAARYKDERGENVLELLTRLG